MRLVSICVKRRAADCILRLVIGERLVVPSSIVYLVVKLRLTPPRGSPAPATKEKDAEETKRILKFNDEKDNQFLNSKDESEGESSGASWAHAPYWPGVRDTLHPLRTS